MKQIKKKIKQAVMDFMDALSIYLVFFLPFNVNDF